MKFIEIYTDGACSGNPGAGGYAAILRFNDIEKVVSGGEPMTTNNRMELLAVINALEALKEVCKVIVYSDSKYVVDAIEKGWAVKWQKNGWMRNSKDKALNPDLWERLLNKISQHDVSFEWVRGHDGHEENERCDALARQEIKRILSGGSP